MKPAIAFFDFDGTITTSDSLASFIKYSRGNLHFYSGLLKLSPSLVGFKLGLLSRQAAKEKLLTHFFSGASEPEFAETAGRFAREIVPAMVRPRALERMNWHHGQGHTVVVVSASPSHWVRPWCHVNGSECIATELLVMDGRITGKISGNNCYGQTKVDLIRSAYQLADYEEVYAYGDSKGDRPMLGLASHPSYKPFR